MCIGARSTGSMNNHLHPSPTFLSTVNCGLVFHIKYWHVTFEVGQLENVAFYFQEFEIFYRFEFFGHNLPCVCAWKFFDRPTRWNTQKGQFDWAETKYKADNKKKKKCVYSISSWLIGWCNRAEKTLLPSPHRPPKFLFMNVLKITQFLIATYWVIYCVSLSFSLVYRRVSNRLGSSSNRKKAFELFTKIKWKNILYIPRFFSSLLLTCCTIADLVFPLAVCPQHHEDLRTSSIRFL